jgi:hypothetical protein
MFIKIANYMITHNLNIRELNMNLSVLMSVCYKEISSYLNQSFEKQLFEK